jgi:hypothetical protein
MSNKKLDLTVIIPINKLETELDKQLFPQAIDSIFNQKNDVKIKEVLIVTNSETKKQIEEIVKINKNTRFVINEEGCNNVQNQINKGVSEIKTEYFMVLDSDDELTDFYFQNIFDHMEEMKNVDMFLPLIADVTLDKKIHRYINEISWAKDVTNDKHGYLTMETLMNYNLISINGSIIRKSKFEEAGGLKESIKLSFVYEFLMRFTNIDGIAYTIPKIGYLRKMGRENCYLASQAEMESDEVNFWWSLAKKEYVWPHDRNKTYIKKQEVPLI